MTALTDHNRTGAFISSEGNNTISREQGTLASGQNLYDGTIVMDDGTGKLTALTAVGTAGDLDGTVLGILIGDVNASSSAQPAAYLARYAEVTDSKLTYPTESTAGGEKVATKAALKTLGIIVRA